ncbi:hypothetical protein Poli38472_013024 [Pythium oligandrum]|uniref:Anaphase-promoting complex subunit 4 WD40 domain-containing protein n=1 Tax=Pythium oligandrum TaxID=41045 RepID=A0A8K1CJ49_PYTOL|nr:hypothetical protein Poli38472_013024 [Pythium oligandrum]|eukprot:TMW64402.1 hypothetical protein Poli38472_013024 [Pythium oligandrum]
MLMARNDGDAATRASMGPMGVKGGLETDVSTPMKVSSGLVQWSPCGAFLAVGTTNRLTIREKSTLQIVQQYVTVDVIQSIAWSEDSQLVLTAMYKRGVVQVWSVKDVTWSCKINEGVAGMTYAMWAPDARHVITVSDFQLHATVWSLMDASKSVIRSPKLGAEGFAFSPDERYLAVLERHECKDSLGLYSCETWELVSHFALESYDCVEVTWAPDSSTLAIRDSHLEYRVLLYANNGTLLARYQAYENALGVKTMAWSSSGQFLAIGSYDDSLRVLSHLNWKPIAEFDHETLSISITRVTKDAVEYEEHYADEPIADRPHGKRIAVSQRRSGIQSNSASAASAATQAAGGKRARDICFVVREPPFSVIVVSSDPFKEDPKLGISRALWSCDSAFVATRSDQMPHNVWLWETETMKLHTAISFIHAVKALRWDPTSRRLAICSGDNRVYLWSADGISWVDIPAGNFKALGLRWNPAGNALIAVGKQEFCSLTI